MLRLARGFFGCGINLVLFMLSGSNQTLLGIDPTLADDYESVLAEDDRLDRHHLRRGHAEYSAYEVFRPGT